MNQKNKKRKPEIPIINSEDKNLDKITFLKDIVNDSYAHYWLDNVFTVFKSVNNILLLIYATFDKSIISYNIYENKKLNEIKNAHQRNITNFRHFLDNKTDLVISISNDDSILKLWDINNLECLLKLKNIYDLFSAIFFKDHNNYKYIITSSGNHNIQKEPIKFFDMKGNIVKELKDSKCQTFFIDSYYDIKKLKYYIITGNSGYVKSYNYNNNSVYHKYGDNDKEFHNSLLINSNETIIKLIESNCKGEIKIWDFHSGKLLKQIIVGNYLLKGISLLNNEYLFVASGDKNIKLLNLKTGIVIQDIPGHNSYVLTVKIIIHPNFGYCLISQGAYHGPIKLWAISNQLIK